MLQSSKAQMRRSLSWLDGGTGSQDVVVTYDISGDATKTEDYDTPSESLTIAAGATQGTIAIPTRTDDRLEGTESLTVTLSGADSGVGDVDLTDIQDDRSDSIGIRDPDGTVLVTVEDAETNEGEAAEFSVKLSGEVSAPVTITYSTTDADGTATSGTDYTAASNETIEVPANKTEMRISVPTSGDDNKAEASETFTVTLDSVTVNGVQSNVHIGRARATGTIHDIDPLTVTVTGDGYVPEGSSATYTIALEGGTGSSPVEVDYTVSGTATPGIDFEQPDEKLVIDTDDDKLTLVINTSADQELDESLIVTLTAVRTMYGMVTLGTPREARTILAGEDAVIITVADSETAESAGANFTVSLSDTLSDDVELRYETAYGSATTDDFTAASDTLSIDSVSDSGSITFPFEGDDFAEDDETFTLRLSLVDPPDGVVLATPGAQGTINDDDFLTVSVSRRAGTVTEGREANFPVTVAGGTSTADVVVEYSIEITNDDDEDKKDYDDPGSMITIPAGTSTATIVIPVREDDILEPDETLRVTLEGATTATGSFAPVAVTGSPATTSIVEAGTVTVSMVETAVTVTEGGEALFPVRLSGKVSVPVTVGYSTGGGDATKTGNDRDYETGDTGELVIEAGNTTGTITIDTVSDNRAEDDETFTVTLTDPPTATDLPANSVVIGTGEATATIRDDDALTVTVEGSDRVAQDDDATYRFRLNGDKTGRQSVTVKYTENGTPGTDRTIPAGQSVSLDFTVGTSSLSEGQTLVVRITEVSTGEGRVTPGSPREKRTQIMHADTVTVGITAPSNGTVAEDVGNATFSVTQQGTLSGGATLTVTYEVVAGSASRADFTTPSTRTIVSPNTSFDIPIVDDMVAEGAETFSVRLTDADSSDPDDVVVRGTTTALLTIEASDELTAKVSSQDTNVLEGESATFVVELVELVDGSDNRGTSTRMS